MAIKDCAQAMAAYGKTKALLTSTPRWVSAPKFSAWQWSWW